MRSFRGCSMRAGARSCERRSTTTSAFRSTVVMERHGYGRGVYRYFAQPDAAAGRRSARASLRASWRRSRTRGPRRSASRGGIRRRSTDFSSGVMLPARRGRRRCCCATAPATTTRCTRTSTATSRSRCRRPCCLSEPGADFDGGEFVLVEQRPRKQSLAHVVPLRRGRRRGLPQRGSAGGRGPRLLPDGVPARGRRGALRRAGDPGLILHDAR